MRLKLGRRTLSTLIVGTPVGISVSLSGRRAVARVQKAARQRADRTTREPNPQRQRRGRQQDASPRIRIQGVYLKGRESVLGTVSDTATTMIAAIQIL